MGSTPALLVARAGNPFKEIFVETNARPGVDSAGVGSEIYAVISGFSFGWDD